MVSMKKLQSGTLPKYLYPLRLIGIQNRKLYSNALTTYSIFLMPTITRAPLCMLKALLAVAKLLCS